MKIIYYLLIFLLAGAIIGYLYGLNYQPNCPIDSETGMRTECMGDPNVYGNIGLIYGAIIGIIIGYIIGFFINRKK